MDDAPTYEIAEIEAAFRDYWQAGIIREDWNAWADLFTEDAVYYERILGTMRGREAIREWIVPLMERYGEIYGIYEWHTIEPSGRVVFYMQNRRDRPGGGPPMDFPGISILQYAGGGRWSMEEDYWALPLSQKQFKEYEALLAAEDPEHRARRTRMDWGQGPDWTRGPSSGIR